MRRAASQLSLSCGPGSGAHPGVRPALCVDCRLALPHAALGLIAIRSILSRPELCARRNTSGRWFPTPALELAGVPPLDGMAILAGRSRPRNFASLSWRHVALPARLVEAVDRRFAPGSGGARSLLHSRGPQETGRRGLGLPPDHARARRGTGIPGCVSVFVEPCFRETVATGQQRPCRCGPATSCTHRSPRGYCPNYVE